MREAGLRLPAEAWSVFESGEYTGRLGEAMVDIGEFLRERQRRRSELMGQLWYPGLVLLTGFLVMSLILFWVVPQMRGVSQSMGQGQDLPWLTENIGRLYGSIFGLLIVFILGLSGLVTAFRYLARRSSRSADSCERLYRCLPGLGWLRRNGREARITRQVGTLLRGGVTLPRALDLAAGLAPDLWEQRQLLEFRTRLLMGAGFNDALGEFQIVHAESRLLLMAGQESGQLDHYMERIAHDLDERISRTMGEWIRFLEPAMLLFLSIAVGGLILAYLLPMVRMLERLA